MMTPTPRDPFPDGRERRRIRRAILGLTVTGLIAVAGRAGAATPLIPTPANAAGPFYPRAKPADSDADLTQVAGRSQRASGTFLYLSGQVLAVDGRPLPGSEIELWQANAFGRYAHPSDGDSSGPLDPGFQGYCRLTTDAEGRYRIKTVKPGLYSGRTVHLHFSVASARTNLTTQMFFEGERENERDGLYRYLRPDERKAATGRPAERTAGMEEGAVVLAWDIVLTA